MASSSSSKISNCLTTEKTKAICFRFLKGNCEEPCGKVHTYHYCKDFQNGNRCSRRNCRFMHISSMEQYYYTKTAVKSEKILNEAERTCQVAGVCKDNLNQKCFKQNCSLKHSTIGHVIEREEISCPICTINISAGLLAVTKCCNHGICINCTERLRHIEDDQFQCPYCRMHAADLILHLSF